MALRRVYIEPSKKMKKGGYSGIASNQIPTNGPTSNQSTGNEIYPIYKPNMMATPEIQDRKSIGPVDREDANLEAEKGETAWLPDVQGLAAHFNIGGKRHSAGGTPLNLPDDSFIFSDTAKMKIKDPKIKAMFGKTGSKGITPADIAKQYDINEFRKTLADHTVTDPIQIRTAEQMIANYNLKLGKLGLVQEGSKGFPQGIPAVALPYLMHIATDPDKILPLKGTPQQGADQPQPGQGQMQPPQGRYGMFMEDGGEKTYPYSFHAGPQDWANRGNAIMQTGATVNPSSGFDYKRVKLRIQQQQEEEQRAQKEESNKQTGDVLRNEREREYRDMMNQMNKIQESSDKGNLRSRLDFLPSWLEPETADTQIRGLEEMSKRYGIPTDMPEVNSAPPTTLPNKNTPSSQDTLGDHAVAESIKKQALLDRQKTGHKHGGPVSTYNGGGSVKDTLNTSQGTVYIFEDGSERLDKPNGTKTWTTNANPNWKQGTKSTSSTTGQKPTSSNDTQLHIYKAGADYTTLPDGRKVSNASDYFKTDKDLQLLADSMGFKYDPKDKQYPAGSERSANKQWQRFTHNNPDHPEWATAVDRKHQEYGQPTGGVYDGYIGVRWLPDEFANKPPAPTAEVAKKAAAERKSLDTSYQPQGYHPDQNSPWWAQDIVKTAGAAGDFMRLKKYLPWAPPVAPYLGDPTFYDPTRELASNAESANMATQGAGAFGDPRMYAATAMRIQGEGAKAAADTLGKYNNMNVGVADTFEAQKASVMNRANEYNAKTATDLYDKTTAANQNFDNSKAQARQELRQSYMDAMTNRAKTQVLNTMYPNFQIDPTTGGTLGFYKGTPQRGQYMPDEADKQLAYFNKISTALGPKAPSWKDVFGREKEVGSGNVEQPAYPDYGYNPGH